MTTLPPPTEESTTSQRMVAQMKRGMEYLVHHSSSLRLLGFPPFLSHDRPLPEPYYCPITFDLFHTPVIDPEGNTYEYAAIVPWIRTNGTSPLSRTPLSVHQLYPNHAIRQLLDYHASEEEEYYDEDYEDEEHYEDEYDETKEEDNGQVDGNVEQRDSDNDEVSPTPSSSSSSHRRRSQQRRRRSVHPALLKWKTEEPPTLPEWHPTDPTSITTNTANGTSHQHEQLLIMSHQRQLQQLSQNTLYPTTWEELEVYRRTQRQIRQRAAMCTFCSFLCFLAALGLAVFYGGYCIFVTIWLGCCVRDGYQRYRTLQQEQRQQLVLTEERILQGQQRREQLQLRLNQLRLQETQEEGQLPPPPPLQPQDQPPQEGQINHGDIEMGSPPALVVGPTRRTTSILRLDPSLVAAGYRTEQQLQEQIDAEEQAVIRRRYHERLAELLQQPSSQEQELSSTALASASATTTATPTTTTTTTTNSSSSSPA